MNSDNTPANTETFDQLMQRLEKRGMQRTAELMSSSISRTIQPSRQLGETPVKTMEQGITEVVKPISPTSILNIMKEGEEEFVKQTGRHMTYSEMRQLYG